MTERASVPVPAELSEMQLAELGDNFTQPVPVATVPGGPAVAWVHGITTALGTLVAQVQWLDTPRAILRPQFDASPVDVETGAPVGAKLLGFIAAPRPLTASRAPAHLTLSPRDVLAGDTRTETEPMDFIAKTLHGAALRIQASRKCDFQTAMRLAREAANQPLPARAVPLDPPAPIIHAEPGQAHGASECKLSHGRAREHLAAHMKGFDTLSYEQQHAAARKLCGLMNQGEHRKLLSTRPANGKPVVLACLYPGDTPLRRLKAYLAATESDWSKLDFHEQHMRALAARGRFNILDEKAAA